MLNSYSNDGPREMTHSLGHLVQVYVLIAVLVLTQTGCLFKRHKIPAAAPVPVQPVRIAVLPLNTPPDSENLRWLALGTAVVIAKVAQSSQDLDLLPLWESVPLTIDTLGTSRSLAPEQAASIASRLTAKWAVCGEITPAKGGINLLLDFVPSKETAIPFRYERQLDPDALQGVIKEAFEQFLRYLVAKPIGKADLTMPDSDMVRSLAEALDIEYGWRASSEPGKADKLVATLAQSDSSLAPALFNPTLYPVLNRAPAPEEQPKKVPPAAAPPALGVPNPPKPEPSPPESPPSTPPAPSGMTAPPVPAAEQSLPPNVSVSEVPLQRVQTPPPGAPEKPASIFPLAGRTQTGRYANSQPPPAPAATPNPASNPAVTPKPPVEPARGETSPRRTGTFAIQVFSSMSKGAADAAVARLRQAGLHPEVERVDLAEKGIWFRIRLQNFTSRVEASAEGERLRASGLIKEYWIPR
jgi:cell division septation protein DedD